MPLKLDQITDSPDLRAALRLVACHPDARIVRLTPSYLVLACAGTHAYVAELVPNERYTHGDAPCTMLSEPLHNLREVRDWLGY